MEGVTLDAYGIEDGEIIHLGIKYYVSLMNGKTITMLNRADDTVNLVKTYIQINEGIPAFQQRLMFNGEELGFPSSRNLHSYGVGEDSQLTLAVSFCECAGMPPGTTCAYCEGSVAVDCLSPNAVRHLSTSPPVGS